MCTPKPKARDFRAGVPSAPGGTDPADAVDASTCQRWGILANQTLVLTANTPAAVPSATERKSLAKMVDVSARWSPSRSSTRLTISESRVRELRLVANWELRKAERSATVRKLRSLSNQAVFWVMSKTLTPYRYGEEETTDETHAVRKVDGSGLGREARGDRSRSSPREGAR